MRSTLLAYLLLRGASAHRRGALRAAAREQTAAYLAQRRDASAPPCPCADASLCAPIGGAPAAEREFYGFGGDGFESFDWDYVTTVAWGASGNLTCAAHAAGARVVMAAPETLLTPNASARDEWARAALADVTDGLYDGIVFDYEDPLPARGEQAAWYAQLINATKLVFAAANPSLQVSACVAWSPDDIDGRGYEVATMCAAADLCYVMDYDTRSQVTTQCIASANAPLAGARLGVGRYLDLGVSPEKLVLGVPWYGYRYECLPGTPRDATFCPIPLVPFRGVNCSDAAGGEVPYANIMRVADAPDARVTARGWDANMAAPWMNVVEANATVQYWWDDPDSLALKYAFAKRAGLRGVGPFTWSDLDPENAPEETAAMWAALGEFL